MRSVLSDSTPPFFGRRSGREAPSTFGFNSTFFQGECQEGKRKALSELLFSGKISWREALSTFKFNSSFFQGECQEWRRFSSDLTASFFRENSGREAFALSDSTAPFSGICQEGTAQHFPIQQLLFRENVRKGSAQHFRNQQPLIYRENVRKESVHTSDLSATFFRENVRKGSAQHFRIHRGGSFSSKHNRGTVRERT